MKSFINLLCLFFAALLFSCNKIENKLPYNLNTNLSGKLAALVTSCATHPIIDSMPAVNTDGDSTDEATILGVQRSNPYTVANMVQAYNNLGLTNVTVTANNQYVRFLPSSVAQLSVLDSVLDSQNLEMFDAPMDYDIVKEGNYYQDPSIPDTMVTWQYAVVPTTFIAPAGITYQVLSQIHIPTDTYVAVETEAERLASKQDSIVCSGGGNVYIVQTIPSCPAGWTWDAYGNQCVHQCRAAYHWDYNLHDCVFDNCPPGYHWGGSGCVSDVQVPPPPPPPSPDQAVPAGNITVTDNNLNTTPGVRNVRVVAKRWFKIERSYTDNAGHFQFTKRFKHKVKLVVKFKNDYCNIRTIRGIRLWQSLYVVRKTIGVYSGDKSNINFNFGRDGSKSNTRTNNFWVSATTINAVQEHRDYSATYGFSAPPMGLNIYLTNWGKFEGIASTPLFGKRFWKDFPASFGNTYLVYAVTAAVPIVGWYAWFYATVARTRLDMAIDYHKADMSTFTSDFIKETLYHELSHASHYTQVGTGWYSNLVNAELSQIAAHPLPSDPFNPYGISTSTDAPIIALGEAWGYHMGHFLADQRYGTLGSCQKEQAGGSNYCPNPPTNTDHPHIKVLEAFNPNLGTDPFNWIPKGLMEDLIDATNETYPITDNVSGFTISQLFNGLQSDVSTLQQYRARLIQQNPTISATNITNLFGQYNYH